MMPEPELDEDTYPDEYPDEPKHQKWEPSYEQRLTKVERRSNMMFAGLVITALGCGAMCARTMQIVGQLVKGINEAMSNVQPVNRVVPPSDVRQVSPDNGMESTTTTGFDPGPQTPPATVIEELKQVRESPKEEGIE